MSSKKMKTFVINETEFQFNVTKFKELFNRYAIKQDSLKGEYEYELAELLYVERATIHAWRMGSNAPSDLEKIHMLEKYWHLQENSLVTEVNEMDDTKVSVRPLTDEQRAFIKKAYQAYNDFIKEFIFSDGFKYAIILEELFDDELPNEERTPYDKENSKSMVESFSDLVIEEGYFVLDKTLYGIMLDFLDRVVTVGINTFKIFTS